MTAPKMGMAEWIYLLVLSVIWGSSFVLIEYALKSFSPFFTVFLRVFIGALTLTVILAAQGVLLPRDRKMWVLFLIMGILQNALPFSLITWGQQYITAGLSSIFNGTTPFFAVILAHFFTQNEKATPGKVIGVMFGIVGVVVIIGPDNLSQFSFENLGAFAVLGAAVCYAVALVVGVQFKGLNPGVIPAGMLWMASFIMLPPVLLGGAPVTAELTVSAVGAVIALGVVCSAIAFIIFYRILEKGGATNTSLVTFLVPVSALLMAWLLLGETLSLMELSGIGLIFCGLVVVDGRLVSLVRPKKIPNPSL